MSDEPDRTTTVDDLADAIIRGDLSDLPAMGRALLDMALAEAAWSDAEGEHSG